MPPCETAYFVERLCKYRLGTTVRAAAALLCLPLVASCVSPQAPYYGSLPAPTFAAATYPASPPIQSASAPSRSGTVVNFAGQGDGSLLSVRLTSLSGGRTRADGETQGDGTACAGAFSGEGTFNGNRLVVRDKGAPSCPITLTRNGRSLTVDADSAGRSCLALHGASCSLSGQLAQR